MPTTVEWLSALLGRCYGKALVLYPAEFRDEFGAEMMQFFRDDFGRTVRSRGVAGLLLLGLRTCFDGAICAGSSHGDYGGTCVLAGGCSAVLRDSV